MAKSIVARSIGLPGDALRCVEGDEGFASQTSITQRETERECGEFLGSSPAYGYAPMYEDKDVKRPKLLRPKHLAYLFRGMHELPRQFSSLDSSRPWLAYWIFTSMDFLGHQPPAKLLEQIIDFLANRC